MRMRAFLLLTWVLAAASAGVGARASVLLSPSPSQTLQATPRPPRSSARTIQIDSSYGSIFGNTHDTVTIVHTNQGGGLDGNDSRIDALVKALTDSCIPHATPAELGPDVTPGQRRWFDSTFTQGALDYAVTYYYAHDFGNVDGVFASVRVSLSDTSGAVVAAASTAQQALMLPWSVTSRDQATCASWNPRISRAITAYLSGNAAGRLNGTYLARDIANAFIRQHLREWNTIPVKERFGHELKRLSSRYAIYAAALQRYAAPGVPPEVDIELQQVDGPRNVLLSLSLSSRGSRLPDLDAALAAAPRVIDRLNAFTPIHAKLRTEGYNVWATVPITLTSEPSTAAESLRACGGNDLAARRATCRRVCDGRGAVDSRRW